jgi:DNA-binding response OmpR family regulator
LSWHFLEFPMPSVLAIAPGAPDAIAGRGLFGANIIFSIANDARRALAEASTRVFDLLVLSGMSVDEQQEVVTAFHAHRRWRLVPVLYLLDPAMPGLAIPGTFRPEIDGLVRGTLESPEVRRRVLAMAREGVAEADLVVAGPYELDPVRSVFRLPGLEVTLTEREAEILGILLARPNRTISAAEIIERGWGAEADARYLQILRRHVSNIRRKLHRTAAARSVRTVRGAGYRFEIRLAS